MLPASFADRFRVTARKQIYFQKHIIGKLDPTYLSCNERQTSCTRKKAEPRKGCPTCEFTIQYKLFKASLDEELKHIKRGTWTGARRWPSSFLLKHLVEIATLSNSEKGKNPNWPLFTSMLVSIYRDEVAKSKAVDDYNDKLKGDAEREAAKNRGKNRD